MKPSAAERYKLHHLRAMPPTNLPVRDFGEYKGIVLPENVERRIQEYRKIPSFNWKSNEKS
jgi:hypothetical protein